MPICRGALPAWLVALVLLMSVSCASAQNAAPPLPAALPWYNVSRPLTWTDLKGRAVLLDFFTPGCINCVHMVPVEAALERRFGPRLVIVGVDSPKFTDSGSASGLEDFMREYRVQHPVVLDTHQQLWNEWQVFAWPTLFLVGPDGRAVQKFIGEQTFDDLAVPIAAVLSHAPPASALGTLPLAPMAASAGMLDAPGGIAVSGDRVAISDTGHDRIIVATKQGRVTEVVGDGCAGGRDGRIAVAQFSRPHGLTFHDGKLYVADTQGQRIRVVDLATRQVTTLAGTGKRAYVASGSFPARDAVLNSPWDLRWVDDKLYVSMAGDHDIWRYDPVTGQFGPWAGNGREGLRDGSLRDAEFAQPSGLDAYAGELYDADPESSAIRGVSISRGRVDTLIGQGLFRFGKRDGAASHALLQHAEGVLRLGDSLYIADTFNDALRRLDLGTGQVSTVATDLHHPQALAALGVDTLLVTEAGGNRVAAVDVATGKVSPWHLEGLAPAACATRHLS